MLARRSLPVLLLVLVGCGGDAAGARAALESASYVGGRTCAECHAGEHEKWVGSHHDLAMQPADASTVLGDFSGVELTHQGVTSRFFRDGERFMVRTDGADGEMADFEVRYVFGVEPLQQYLVEFERGAIQTLPLAWDTRASEDGGQRWYHVYPDETIPHDDILHWTGKNQNWNNMCAACHSTGLEKAYDIVRGEYATRWSEIDVSCEACHGPGSEHVKWAKAGGESGEDPRLLTDLGRESTWAFRPGEPTAHRVEGAEPHAGIATCAACHSRRSEVLDRPVHGAHVLDSHRVELLVEPLYFVDGQIRDEVYVWGSFLQSKMYRAGVTCSDCHEPHSSRLIAEGNALCVRCHSVKVFDAPSHHHHEPGSAGASCVECHMPDRAYMVVDDRRDHSIRIPRPDLSDELGTPNACNECHTDQSSKWAADAIRGWGYEPKPHYGETFHAARKGKPEAHAELLTLARDAEQSPLVRATALADLPLCGDPSVALEFLGDPEPLVRFGALQALSVFPAGSLPPAVTELLDDPVQLIRTEVARMVAGTEGEKHDAFLKALGEYTASMRANADRGWAHTNLGILHAQRGDVGRAASAYQAAIDIEPALAPAWANLADLFRSQGDDAAGEEVLRQAIEKSVDRPPLYHALGLLLVRKKDNEGALKMLDLAASLSPDNPRFGYSWVLALHSFEDERALPEARKLAKRFPRDTAIVDLLRVVEGR